MFVVIHKMDESMCCHVAPDWEVAVKVGADICMDLLGDMGGENEWLQEQMEGCNNQKRYEDVICLWNDHAEAETNVYIDRVLVLEADYHKE